MVVSGVGCGDGQFNAAQDLSALYPLSQKVGNIFDNNCLHMKPAGNIEEQLCNQLDKNVRIYF